MINNDGSSNILVSKN